MMTEWLRVMLEEIARKKTEAEQARAEEERRAKDVIESRTCASREKLGDAE
jgi:hypothetical protein